MSTHLVHKENKTWWLPSNYFTVRLFQVVITADITVGKCIEKEKNSITPRLNGLGLPFPIHLTFTRNIWQFTQQTKPFGFVCFLLFTCFGPVTWFSFLFHLIFGDSQFDTFRKWLSELFLAFNMFHFTDCICSLTICDFVSANRFYKSTNCWNQTVAIKIKKQFFHMRSVQW